MHQPDFLAELARGNLSFRIPTPLYGAGLLEAIPDAEILRNQQSDLQAKRKLGIYGEPNRDPRDGTVGRFGWKAQTRSLEVFAAEAYLVEQGVTNEIFPEERGNAPAECLLNSTPEDHKILFARRPADAHSNVSRFAQYMRFLAAPEPPAETPAIMRGRDLFLSVGCGICHTPVLKTGQSIHPSLATKAVPLYSDLLVHHMGECLADEVEQGNAGPDMFRTAPLWGLGRRIFLLHDGRTKDLVEAIEAHADLSVRGRKKGRSPRSEANASVRLFHDLSVPDQQDLLNFLRSL